MLTYKVWYLHLHGISAYCSAKFTHLVLLFCICTEANGKKRAEIVAANKDSLCAKGITLLKLEQVPFKKYKEGRS